MLHITYPLSFYCLPFSVYSIICCILWVLISYFTVLFLQITVSGSSRSMVTRAFEPVEFWILSARYCRFQIDIREDPGLSVNSIWCSLLSKIQLAMTWDSKSYICLWKLSHNFCLTEPTFSCQVSFSFLFLVMPCGVCGILTICLFIYFKIGQWVMLSGWQRLSACIIISICTCWFVPTAFSYVVMVLGLTQGITETSCIRTGENRTIALVYYNANHFWHSRK